MQYEIIIKENSPFTHYCPRPLVQSDVRAYKVLIKSNLTLEGAAIMATAVRSDGQVITDVGDVYDGYGEYVLASNMYAVEGEMRLMLTVVDYDGAALTAKEIIFNVEAAPDTDAIDGEDRLPVLNSLIAQCSDLLDSCESLEENYGQLITTCYNLLSPDHISDNGSNGIINISGLEKGKAYCLNFIPYTVMGITDDGEAESVNYTTKGDAICISAGDMKYTTLSIPFPPNLDSTYFMLVEGETLPPYYKKYGTWAYINDQLLTSVYSEIDKIKPTEKVITVTNGEAKLTADKVHILTVDGDIRFVLPEVTAFSQILVHANVTAKSAIDWGTTYFFNSETPYVEAGKYNFIFEYDGGVWYAGAIPKGIGETA